MAIDPVLEAIERRFEAVDVRFDRLERDLAPINAEHARLAAAREAALIAEDSGLTFIRTLSDAEIRDLVQSSDTAGISVNDLRSFRLADLILESARLLGGELLPRSGNLVYRQRQGHRAGNPQRRAVGAVHGPAGLRCGSGAAARRPHSRPHRSGPGRLAPTGTGRLAPTGRARSGSGLTSVTATDPRDLPPVATDPAVPGAASGTGARYPRAALLQVRGRTRR